MVPIVTESVRCLYHNGWYNVDAIVTDIYATEPHLHYDFEDRPVYAEDYDVYTARKLVCLKREAIKHKPNI